MIQNSDQIKQGIFSLNQPLVGYSKKFRKQHFESGFNIQGMAPSGFCNGLQRVEEKCKGRAVQELLMSQQLLKTRHRAGEVSTLGVWLAAIKHWFIWQLLKKPAPDGMQFGHNSFFNNLFVQILLAGAFVPKAQLFLKIFLG
tara:strand:- start:9829 stop:10254 length:426 start_codon:yes stop_codon:yes gene_type:complete